VKSAIEFLRKMYLPGYMVIKNQNYGNNKQAWFNFQPVEPQVTVLSDKYLTPRGAHIFLSQGLYCFAEQIIPSSGYCSNNELQQLGFEGRLKMVEINERFKKEIELSNIVQGRIILTKMRMGKMPIIKFNFDLGERGIVGDLTCVIAPKSLPQTNYDILRKVN
jgi:hypothetical protein